MHTTRLAGGTNSLPLREENLRCGRSCEGLNTRIHSIAMDDLAVTYMYAASSIKPSLCSQKRRSAQKPEFGRTETPALTTMGNLAAAYADLGRWKKRLHSASRRSSWPRRQDGRTSPGH